MVAAVVVIGWWSRRCWRRGAVSVVTCMQKRNPAGVLYFHSLTSPTPPLPLTSFLYSHLYSSMVFISTSCCACVFSHLYQHEEGQMPADTQYSTLYTERDTYKQTHTLRG